MVRTIESVTDALIHRSRLRKLELSNLMLQKLLYYAQAWHLVLAREALFNEEIEAWVHGPVIPCVFRRFKHLKWDAITEQVAVCSDTYLAGYMDAILDRYGKFSPKQLERLTHSERPWCDARIGLAADEPSHKIITKDAMWNYFSSLLPNHG